MFRSSNGVSSTSINHSDKLIAVPHFNVVDIRDISIDNIATVKRMDTCYMIRVRKQDNLYTNVVGPDLTMFRVIAESVANSTNYQPFYPRDAMLARVIAIATCLSLRPSVRHAPVLCQNEES